MHAAVETGLPEALHCIYTSLIEQRQSSLTQRQRGKLHRRTLIVDNPIPEPFNVETGTIVYLGKDTDQKLVLAAALGYFPETDTLAVVGGIHLPEYTFWGVRQRLRHPDGFQTLVNGSPLGFGR